MAICKPHGTNWTCINLSTNFAKNVTYCATIDQTQPNLLWIGNDNGKITLLDMDKMEVVGESHLTHGDGWIQWMFDDGDDMIVIAMGYYSNTYNLYCYKKAEFSGANQAAAGSGQNTPPFSPPSPSAPNPQDGDWPFNFLQQNYSKFATVQFKKDENGQAVLQRLQVGDNMFMYRDQLFFGIKFTVPAWLDGDFKWIFFPIKTEQNKFFSSNGGMEGVVTEDGAGDGSIDQMEADPLAEYPRLHELLPYTHWVQIQTVRQDRLEPGKTCVIWFEVEEKDYPDELFAITINSKRGAEEFGTLPLTGRIAAPEPVTSDNPPLTPEQLRSRLETALKSKNEAAALSLVYWQRASGLSVPDEDLQFDEYSRNGVVGEIDRMLAQPIGSVTLRPWSYPLSMTNVVDGARYGPNIPGVAELQVESTDRKWVEFMLFGKKGDGYYIPVGIKEPIQAAK